MNTITLQPLNTGTPQTNTSPTTWATLTPKLLCATAEDKFAAGESTTTSTPHETRAVASSFLGLSTEGSHHDIIIRQKRFLANEEDEARAEEGGV